MLKVKSYIFKNKTSLLNVLVNVKLTEQLMLSRVSKMLGEKLALHCRSKYIYPAYENQLKKGGAGRIL